MEDDSHKETSRIIPANDNGAGDEPSAETWIRIDQAALTLARIIGRPQRKTRIQAEV